MFLKLIKQVVTVLADILGIFGRPSGLVTNRAKCAVYPIRCDGINVDEVTEDLRCPIAAFPCSYLGLPLHYKALRRVEVYRLGRDAF